MDRDRILKAVWDAIDHVNALLSEEQHIVPSENTILLGKGAAVDSLGLINLIVAVEQSVGVLGQELSLTNDDELIRGDGPLQTVGALVDHIFDIVNG